MQGLLSLVAALALLSACTRAAVTANISSTPSPETDWATVYYGPIPILIGNDASPDTGGFHAWTLQEPLPEASIVDVYTRRSSLTLPLYDIGGRDVLLTLSEPDTLLHVFEGLEQQQFDEVVGAQKKLLGDWSSLCGWRSAISGEQYVFVFGKEDVVQLLVRNQREVEIVEVQRFPAPIEAEGCTVSRNGTVYFTSEDDGRVFAFTAEESTTAPEIEIAAEIEDITGFTLYAGEMDDFLLVATTDVVTVYSSSFEPVGEIELAGEDELEIQGLTVFQSSTDDLPLGALAFASESEDNAGFAIASLEGAFKELEFSPNTAYSPRQWPGKIYWHDPKLQFWLRLLGLNLICEACSSNGFCSRKNPWFLHQQTDCECFAGFGGERCEEYTCVNDCSGRGQCVGPNTCQCDGSWGGPDCSWLNVEATYETDSVEGDADDAAIWISPVSNEHSRVITTIKSEEGAGLAVFDSKGNRLQHFEAGEPNNVNIIYNFPLGERQVDLTFAACREDDTLCLAEVARNGTLLAVEGGDQPVKDDFTVYGSCAYQSKETGKTYLIVNSKDAEFLQYELTSTDEGALDTTLVRNFTGGTGDQVEGCVTDAENGYIFLGEELYGLWRYEAEPDAGDEGQLVDSVKGGHLDADVEGVTLLEGSDSSLGFLLVSSQGTSSFNIYRRAPPHDFVLKFTVVESADGQIDGVTNTDGINSVATALGPDFPKGLVVVHDDANELPSEATSPRASFKMLSLGDILGAEEVAGLDLLSEVDPGNDPRA